MRKKPQSIQEVVAQVQDNTNKSVFITKAVKTAFVICLLYNRTVR